MSDDLKGDQSTDGKTIKGEVLRVEGDTYFIKGQDGKDVRLQTDKTTEKIGSVKQGDRIEAKNQARAVRRGSSHCLSECGQVATSSKRLYRALQEKERGVPMTWDTVSVLIERPEAELRTRVFTYGR